MASLTPISGLLGTKNAAHFLRRTTFGPTRTAIDEFASKTVTQALTDIMQTLSTPEPPIDPKTGLIPMYFINVGGWMPEKWHYMQGFLALLLAVYFIKNYKELTTLKNEESTPKTKIIDKTTKSKKK